MTRNTPVRLLTQPWNTPDESGIAAQAAPASAKTSAATATTIAGDGRRNFIYENPLRVDECECGSSRAHPRGESPTNNQRRNRSARYSIPP